MISGLVVINKAKNISSHAVVEKIRTCFKTEKVGHFGTLDPLAEGILLIGIGKATKFFEFYNQKKKLYSGKIKFGFATTTFDQEGTPLSEKKNIDLNKIEINSILTDFTGEILQVPPIYSAKKFKGKPLYKYARAKKKIEPKPVKVHIYDLKWEIVDSETLGFEALTSAGTYIRSLAHDIGKRVGTGAYLAELRREKIGEFDCSSAISSSDLSEDTDPSILKKHVFPIETLLPEFPKIIINEAGKRGVVNGMALEPKDIIKIFPSESTSLFRLFDEEGKLLAIAKKDEKVRKFNPSIVFPD